MNKRDDPFYINWLNGDVKFNSELEVMYRNPRTKENTKPYMAVTDVSILPRRSRRQLERKSFKVLFGKTRRF